MLNAGVIEPYKDALHGINQNLDTVVFKCQCAIETLSIMYAESYQWKSTEDDCNGKVCENLVSDFSHDM